MGKQTLSSIFLSKIASAVSGASNFINLYSKSDGFVYTKDTDGLERNISTQQFFNSLSAVFPAVAQANTTRVNVTGWSFPVVAGKSYEIKVRATYVTAINTTGGSMGLITSGGAVGNIHGKIEADIVNTATATGLKQPLYTINTVNTTAGSFMTSTGRTTGQPGSFTIDAVFNCTTSGDLNVQWGSEVSNSLAQIRSGSTLIINLLN